MTWLDAAVVLALLLIGAGGYRQGLLRGLTRLSALIAIGLVAIILSGSMTLDGDVRDVITRALTLLAGVVLIVGLLTWFVNRTVPRSFHQMRINRVLGIVPALLQGVIVIALALGFAHRVAIDQAMQEYLARGVVTGPLILPFDWLERAIGGQT